MVTTQVRIREEEYFIKELVDDYSQLNTISSRGPIITLTSDEVAWLFGTDVSTVEDWVTSGIITPCSSTPDGNKRFWREDIAELLSICGA